LNPDNIDKNGYKKISKECIIELSKGMMEKELHLLSRATFGPTPASLRQITALGREAWLDAQLHPEGLNNGDVDRRLRSLPSIYKTATELYSEYPFPEPGQQPIPGKEFWRPFVEVSGAMFLLGRYSETQLLELMANFWFNHFNVYGPENINFWALTPYVMTVIRKNALGKFPELLLETGQSPAMLYYLDNFLSSKEMDLPNGQKRGLNENYARELLELHTLGVEAGYTQQDVINAAKVLTGWSITNPRDGRLEFFYYRDLHDRGKKTVFGKTFPDNQLMQGQDMIRYLALRPETANHIARKLVSHFVADIPPRNLVDRLTNVYLRTEGDIASLLRALLLSAEFNKDKHFRAKVKSPLRYFISALRVTGTEIFDPISLLRPFTSLGQPLFQCHPPTGYPDHTEGVTSAGVFLAESKISRQIAFNRLGGVFMNPGNLVSGNLKGEELARKLLNRLLFVPEQKTKKEVKEAAQTPGFGLQELISLILATPDFCQF
jgi:uncharacterized protein (DUF1800 family)